VRANPLISLVGWRDSNSRPLHPCKRNGVLSRPALLPAQHGTHRKDIAADGRRLGRKDAGASPSLSSSVASSPNWATLPPKMSGVAIFSPLLDAVKAESKLRTANLLLTDLEPSHVSRAQRAVPGRRLTFANDANRGLVIRLHPCRYMACAAVHLRLTSSRCALARRTKSQKCSAAGVSGRPVRCTMQMGGAGSGSATLICCSTSRAGGNCSH